MDNLQELAAISGLLNQGSGLGDLAQILQLQGNIQQGQFAGELHQQQLAEFGRQAEQQKANFGLAQQKQEFAEQESNRNSRLAALQAQQQHAFQQAQIEQLALARLSKQGFQEQQLDFRQQALDLKGRQVDQQQQKIDFSTRDPLAGLDQGPQIPPELLAKLLEGFEAIEGTPKTQY